MSLKKIDIDDAREYLVYLLKEINGYKDDLDIRNEEIEKLGNELQRLKKHVKYSPFFPKEIQNRIFKLDIGFNKKKFEWKSLLKYFFHPTRDHFQGEQIEKHQIVGYFAQDVKSIIREIDKYKFQYNLD